VDSLSTELFTATLALVGVVILTAALLSGLIERSGLPQVAVLLAVGAALGPAGLDLLAIDLESPILRVVATLGLVLVLFTDALRVDLRELRKYAALAGLVLGPGTLLSAALIALAGWWLLALPLAGAVILGAALASTDPVLLRGLLSRRDIPSTARIALRLESGLNDVVLLPIVLVAMAFLGYRTPESSADWAALAIDMFLLGPGAGVLVGLLSVATLDLVRRRIGIRRDYESLYAIGVAFTAFAAAEAVHGSGFLAAFAAGMTISSLDVELCDCFLEYGETTAEMALLFTFVLFGSSLIWSGFALLSLAALLFTAVVILVRPLALLLSLARARIDKHSRLLIAWFGPRGLSSLLLVLLPVFVGLPGAETLFALCCLVVLASVVLHGGSPLLLDRLAPRAGSAEPAPTSPLVLPPGAAPGPPPATPGAPPEPELSESQAEAAPELISIAEYQELERRGQNVIVLDVRTERAFARDDIQARGSIRMPPDHVVERATELGLPKDAWLIAYCA
jgi:NhaP-type Na+/H+ or K+/H+ antiporter